MKEDRYSFLFSLLQTALGNKKNICLLDDLNWMKLCEFSIRQGVGYLVLDAVKDQKVPREVMKQWMGHSMNQEYDYWQYVKKLSDLNAFLREHDIEAMVMKGYGCSLNWPVPEHRPIGDIDIYTPEYAKVDELVGKELGLKIDKRDPHHSVFSYKGVMVENHHTIVGTKRQENIKLESLLEELSQTEVKTVMLDGSPLKIPSANFGALHLLRHASGHFPEGGVVLRHVIDWATFIKAAGGELDWDFVRPTAIDCKMDRFLDVLNEICVHYLGYPAELFPIEHPDAALRDKVIDAIIDTTEVPKLKHAEDYSSLISLFFSRIKYCRRNVWKHRLVYDEGNTISIFYSLVRNYLKSNYL